MVTRSGDRRTVLLSAEVIRVGDEPLILAVLLDITERKHAEAERRELALVPAQNPDPVLRIAADGTILYGNPASAPLLEQWGTGIGRPCPPSLCAQLTACLQSGCRQAVELAWADRTYAFTCAPFPEHGYANVYGHDVTARRRAEDALASQKALLETVLEQAADPIVVVDSAGIVLVANSGARRLYGYDPRGKNLLAVLEPLGPVYAPDGNPVAPEARAIPRALRGETVMGEHQRLRRPDGTWYEYLITATPLRQGQAITGAVALIMDVTADKQAEAKLRAALREKEAALADKETLLREVHHRTKNNLQMLADVLYLQIETLQSPEGRRALQDSSSRLFVIARLHEQLYQTMESGRIRLGDYLGKLLAGVESLHPGTEVRLTAPAEPISLDVDRAIHVGLIVNELVTNALKHAFPARSPGEMGVDLRTAEERLEVRVWDRGTGLPPALDLQSASTLGLKIVRILTERLGARITVEKAPGAAFTLSVPLASPDTA